MKLRKLGSVAIYTAAVTANVIAGVRNAAGQSCAMCYQNAAATGTQGRFALQRGILILALPAIGFFGAILFLLYSRRGASQAVSSQHSFSGTDVPEGGFRATENDCVPK